MLMGLEYLRSRPAVVELEYSFMVKPLAVQAVERALE